MFLEVITKIILYIKLMGIQVNSRHGKLYFSYGVYFVKHVYSTVIYHLCLFLKYLFICRQVLTV